MLIAVCKLVNLIPGREINSEKKEPETDFGKLDVSLPGQIERFLDRAVRVIKGYNLPKNKEVLVIAKILDALDVDKSQISTMISRIKSAGVLHEKEQNTINESTKLTDILKESEEFQQLPSEMKRHFLEIISTYGQYREQMGRKSDIRQIAETLGAIADAAQEYTLREGGDWFDRVTIKRNMGELKKLQAAFEKEAIEATMKLTEEAGKFVTRCLKKPHDFEYDKVFYPFILITKKRYIGIKYEKDPEKYYFYSEFADYRQLGYTCCESCSYYWPTHVEAK